MDLFCQQEHFYHSCVLCSTCDPAGHHLPDGTVGPFIQFNSKYFPDNIYLTNSLTTLKNIHSQKCRIWTHTHIYIQYIFIDYSCVTEELYIAFSSHQEWNCYIVVLLLARTVGLRIERPYSLLGQLKCML